MAQINIGGTLHSTALGPTEVQSNIVTNADEVLDVELNKKQDTINSELTSDVSDLKTAVGTGGSVDSRIASAKTEILGDASTDYNTLGKIEDSIESIDSTLENAAYLGTDSGTAVITGFDPQSDTLWKKAQVLSTTQKDQVKANLGLDSDFEVVYSLYRALNQSDIVVGTLPVTGNANTIYRVPGESSYTDWMYYNNSWVEMATYNNAIDDEPTAGSENLVKSGGVFKLQESITGYTSKDLTRGGYYNPEDGEYVSNNNTCSKLRDISSTTKHIHLWNYREGSLEGVLFFDSNGTYIQNSFVVAEEGWIDVEIPLGASKVAMNAIYSISSYTAKFIFSMVPIYLGKEAFHSGELLKDVDIDNDIDEENVGLAKSSEVVKYVNNKVSSALINTEVVVELSYAQTSYNPPYRALSLSKGQTYQIDITGTGDSLNKFTWIVFYNSASETVYAFGISTNLGNGISFSFTPSDNVVKFKLLANSSFSGTANISLTATRIYNKYVKSDDIDEIIKNDIKVDAGLSFNIFGDILPQSFKTKLLTTNDDILIAVQGDSIVGKTEGCATSDDATHDIPGAQYKSFVSLLQKTVGKNKPFYNRLDSQRSDVDFFLKTGVWEQTYGESVTDAYTESSVTSLTFRSNDPNAAIQFTFDASIYDKCNIIFSKYPSATNTEIVIQGGNDIMEASLDRENWSEASGFECIQSTPSTSNTNGVAACERHRRIWLRKKAGVTGEVIITYRKKGEGSDYMYCWGTEMYSGRAFLFDNIGRGGRTVALLGRNISDIFDRKPDLTIFEMPLANDLHSSTLSNYEGLLTAYYNYFLRDLTTINNSYYKRSEAYTKYPILIVLPHPRAEFFDENTSVVDTEYQVSGMRQYTGYEYYKRIWGYLFNNLHIYDNVAFVNICDQYLNECVYRYENWENGLTGGHLTSDNIHLNQIGANIYNKYLAPIFQV